MYSEKDSFKYISPLKGKEPEYYKAFIQRSINANQLETCVWSVNLKSGEFIGTINLNYSEVIEGFQIGCHLKRDYWGNGFAKELFHELIRFAFEERKLPEIGSIYETNNLASAKLMQLFQLEIQSVKMEGEIEIAICKLANPF
ncbi:MAG: GNAT family N-acetyltransferase [Crocinitomicaceae bacterium]|nr:GNAT family N-acetyltransferase [Crocinitomicaceae bacterium]